MKEEGRHLRRCRRAYIRTYIRTYVQKDSGRQSGQPRERERRMGLYFVCDGFHFLILLYLSEPKEACKIAALRKFIEPNKFEDRKRRKKSFLAALDKSVIGRESEMKTTVFSYTNQRPRPKLRQFSLLPRSQIAVFQKLHLLTKKKLLSFPLFPSRCRKFPIFCFIGQLQSVQRFLG